jgi:hypothetical protein
MLRGEVDPTMMGDYNQAIQKIVAAHQQHDNGNVWAAYARLTGAGGPKFEFYLPMSKMAEMDAWTPNFQILAAAHGPEEAAKIFQSIQECWTPESLLLAYNPTISNPADGSYRSAPPAAAWHLKVVIDRGAVFEYVGMVQKIVEAHKSHENGLRWIGYSNTVGGHGNEFHFYIMMEKVGDFDGWPTNAQVMSDAIGAEAWGEMQQRLAEIGDSESEILLFSPPHSNAGVGEDG